MSHWEASSPRRKSSKTPIGKSDSATHATNATSRKTEATQVTARSTYADVLAFARRAGIVALCTIAPLGALAGTVSACGGAAPVRPMPIETTPTDPDAVVTPATGAGTTPAPLTSIAPPGPATPTTTPQ